MAEEGICPIESNIKHTIKGVGGGIINKDNNNDIDNNNNIEFDDFDDEFDDEFADENDAEFDDCDGDGLENIEDEWDSIHSSNDGQNMIPVPIELLNNNNNKPIIGVNDENPYGEGNEVAIDAGGRPPIIGLLNGNCDPKQKCWICDICNGINNLLESLKKYNYKCCICSYPYHPNVTIIYSNDWDGVNENNNEQIYTVWNCPFCTLKNNINWNKCDGCECNKPPSNQLEISYSYIKPKKLNHGGGAVNNNNNNIYQQNNNANINNNNKKKNNDLQYKMNKKNIPQRKPRIENIGIARDITEYPQKSVLNDKCEKRLSNIFGLPFKNKLLLPNNKNIWGINNNISHARVEWTSYSNDAKKFVKEEIVGRGFAINNVNGYITSMSSNYVWVFKPNGGLEFKLIARYEFTQEQKLRNEDINNSRIRFLDNNIFVWSFSRSRVYSFKLSYNSIILVDVIKDKYFKDSQTMDIAITNNLLILLFDRWCGVYKLYPKFEWYHAVAFATKSVNCFSLEIINFDHEECDIDIKNNNNKNKKNNRFNIFKNNNNNNEEKEDDKFYKTTNKNYLFINAENQLIGIHPTNPTFDFLHIAKNTKHGKSKYCISKYYGVFYLNNDGKELYQSPNLSYKNNQKLIDLNNSNYLCDKYYPIEDFYELILRNGVEKFCNLCFDEQYGINGRLLLFCQTKKKEYVIHKMFNYNELNILSDELMKIDYYLMPGMDTNKKKFNLIIFIFEYLYGQDLIDTLLQSEKFNPALLKIKKQQENQLKNYKKHPEKDFLMIHKIENNNNNNNNDDVDMDVEYPQEGLM